MNIHVDGGALCADTGQQFGNYIVSKNIIDALECVDKKNKYCIYTFCPNIGRNEPNISYKALLPPVGFMPYRVGFEELLHKSDVFLALNQALPFYTHGKKIVLSHGLSFLKFPTLYTHDYARLSQQLKNMLADADVIVVSSRKVQEQFQKILIKKIPIAVIPFGIPHDLIGKKREKDTQNPFLLYVGMNHPIKNIEGIITAFLTAQKKTKNKTMRLKLVGVGDFHKNSYSHVDVIPTIKREQLINLYQKASAFVSASLYESFNLSIVEALAIKLPVIALQSAVIPELKAFVSVCKNQLDFENKIADGMNGNFEKKKVLNTLLFSWDTFTKKLIKLY